MKNTLYLLLCTLVYIPVTAQTPVLPEGLVQPIAIDSSYQHGNWSAVLEATRNRSILFLGEPNHGAKEIFLLRNDLIRALHQAGRVDVVLFESGIGEVGAPDLRRDTLSGEQLTGGFFGGWRTAEFAALMGYLKQHKIAFGGFDVQRTGNTFAPLLAAEARRKGLDTVLYQQLEERFSRQQRLLSDRKASHDTLQASTQVLMTDYRLLLDVFRINSDSSLETRLVVRTLENRVRYLDYFLEFTRTRDWSRRWKARDEQMAANLRWWLEEIYPGKNVVVVAHNYHIARYNAQETVMGALLADTYGSQMYVLGVFAGAGRYADNAGKNTPMSPAIPDQPDLKNLILSLPGKVHFLPIPQTASSQTAFLFRDMVVNDTFIDLSGTNRLIPARHFDGLLLVDRVSAPVSR